MKGWIMEEKFRVWLSFDRLAGAAGGLAGWWLDVCRPHRTSETDKAPKCQI